MFVKDQSRTKLNRDYTCKICEKSFVNKRRLILHQRTHAGNFFPCDQYEAVFQRLEPMTQKLFELLSFRNKVLIKIDQETFL